MGGTPVFSGTRVPVQTLLDYLEAGDTIGEFLAGFPSVRREQVIAYLKEAKDSGNKMRSDPDPLYDPHLPTGRSFRMMVSQFRGAPHT